MHVSKYVHILNHIFSLVPWIRFHFKSLKFPSLLFTVYFLLLLLLYFFTTSMHCSIQSWHFKSVGKPDRQTYSGTGICASPRLIVNSMLFTIIPSSSLCIWNIKQFGLVWKAEDARFFYNSFCYSSTPGPRLYREAISLLSCLTPH